jgi:hypothetical protein
MNQRDDRAQKNGNGQERIVTNNSYQQENTPFGDIIEYNTDRECFLFHNINGIKDEANWTQINETMKELQVTCFGFSEINVTCRGRTMQRWNNIIRKTFKHSRTSTSESDIVFDQNYKPGGTLTTIVGKWQSRVSERGSDSSGLGCWSYICLSSNKKNLMIIMAYKLLKTQGPTTTWTQQWMINKVIQCMAT